MSSELSMWGRAVARVASVFRTGHGMVGDDARVRAHRIMRTTMALIRLLVVLGILGMLVFAFAPLNVSNWRYLRAGFSVASIGLAIGGAAFLIGALLGFLFGVPRTLQGEVSDRTKRSYQVNTNLEQISDWLTKIIVGITLVDLRTIPTRLMEVSEYLAPALGAGRRGEAMAGGSILYFSVTGFFFGYLGTRLYLAPAIPWADEDSNIESYIAAAKSAVERGDTPTRPPHQPDTATVTPAPEVQKLVRYSDAAQLNAERLTPVEARTVALSYYLTEDYAKAVPFFERANDNILADPSFTMQHAIALAESGARDRAIRLLDELARRSMGAPDVHQLLGYYLLWYPNRLTDAVRHNIASLEADPSDGAAHLNLACAYADLSAQAAAAGDTTGATENKELALVELRAATAADPLWRNRARELRARKEHFDHFGDVEFREALS